MLLLNQMGSKLAMRSGKWVKETSCGWTIYVEKNVGFGKRVWRCTRVASGDPTSDTL